jgi:hypothetical protein
MVFKDKKNSKILKKIFKCPELQLLPKITPKLCW